MQQGDIEGAERYWIACEIGIGIEIEIIIKYWVRYIKEWDIEDKVNKIDIR
jgi:hypothetical protein